MKTYAYCMLFVLANASVSSDVINGDDPPIAVSPEKKIWTGQLPDELLFYPGRPYSGPELGYRSGMSTIWKKDGKEHTNGEIATRGCIIELPGFRYNDIFGFPGGVYRVDFLKPHKTRMQRLEENELPTGVQAPAEDSYVYPIGAFSPFPGGRTGIPDYPRFQVKEIRKQDDVGLTAVIEIKTYIPLGNGNSTSRITTLNIGVSDVFQLGGTTYQVRKLIPANQQTQVVGWIEFVPDVE